MLFRCGALLCFVITLLVPYTSYEQAADGDRGIKWVNNLDWASIKTKAKQEKKYIFVDCFTEWCKPCKRMDERVYSKDEVSSFVNERFISIKVDMDTSGERKNENATLGFDVIKFGKDYLVSSFPTYLFFDPNGQIIHRGQGEMDIADFKILVKNAMDSSQQFYTLFKKFERGTLADYYKLTYLARVCSDMRDMKNANSIANLYLNTYLISKAPEKYSPDEIQFIVDFRDAIRSEDTIFKILLSNRSIIDNVSQTNQLSDFVIDFVITKEEISPFVNSRDAKDRLKWSRLSRTITKKYGSNYGERNVLIAKMKWYERNKKWDKYNKTAILRFERFPLDSTNVINDAILNNVAWYGIFSKSNVRSQLSTAAKWMEGIVRRNPTVTAFLDTYANILYKLGQTELAISVEQKAAELQPTAEDIKANLQKMKKGENTW